MSLPLSDIVKVDISVSPTLAPLAGFGEMLFLTSEPAVLQKISPAERVRLFGSLAEVQEVLPNTEAEKCAMAYFAQTPTPEQFSVGVCVNATTVASLTSGVIKLDEIEAKSYKFKIQIDADATDKEISVTFDTVPTTVAEVAEKVKVGLTTAYSSLSGSKPTCIASGNRIVIEGAATSGGKITFAKSSGTGGNNGDRVLKLNLATGAKKNDALQVETHTQALGLCLDVRPSFVAVVQDKAFRDMNTGDTGNKVVDVADWCEASKKIFLNTTNDVRCLAGEPEVAKALKDKSLRYTITTFGIDEDQYPSASLFGRIATVNYEGTNTCITLKFKKLPTITALDLTKSEKANMDKYNVGGIMNFGGQLMYAESRMADGGWLDAVHGLMWLEDKIQKNVFNLMYGSTTKIPYTDTGINMVRQKVAEALQAGVTNGLLGAGRLPDGTFLPDGWRIIAKSVVEVDQADKSNRIYRGITFDCVGAGALHNAVISGSFNE